MNNGAFIFPHITSLPGQNGVHENEHLPRKQEGVQGEFDKVFENEVNQSDHLMDLNQIKSPLKFSAHASQRLRDRKIPIDALTMAKVNEAVDRAEAKGIEDTLVLTKDAALIVSVKNRTVITAMDRNSLSGSVFTNIDGAVIV